MILLCECEQDLNPCFVSQGWVSRPSDRIVIPATELSPGYVEDTNLSTPADIGLVLAVIVSLTVTGPVEAFRFGGVIRSRLQSALRPRSAIGVA